MPMLSHPKNIQGSEQGPFSTPSVPRNQEKNLYSLTEIQRISIKPPMHSLLGILCNTQQSLIYLCSSRQHKPNHFSSSVIWPSEAMELVAFLTTIVYACGNLCLHGGKYQTTNQKCIELLVPPLGRPSMQDSSTKKRSI